MAKEKSNYKRSFEEIEIEKNKRSNERWLNDMPTRSHKPIKSGIGKHPWVTETVKKDL